MGTVNVFEAVKRRGLPGLAYASSAAVYDRADGISVAEDADGHPVNHYGVHKLANEGTARIYWQDDGIRSVGLRPHIVYGPGRDHGMTAGPTLAMAAAVRGERYEIPFGGRAQFQYAPETAAMFIEAARAPGDGASVRNVGGPSEHVADVIAAIEAAMPEAAGTITYEQDILLALPEDMEAERPASTPLDAGRPGNDRAAQLSRGRGRDVSDRTVVLVGTLDTKGDEYAYLRDRLRPARREHPAGRCRHARAAAHRARHRPSRGGRRGRSRRRRAGPGARPRAGRSARWRRPRPRWSAACYEEGRCDGVLAAGGSGNTAIATAAMQALPVGVPKLMVSTVAAGNTRDYVGASDVAMMASVTDVAGINSISARILANAAAAMAGMVQAPPVELAEQRPLIGGDDVRRHHAVRDHGPRGARAARLRGARVPRHRHRRRRDGGSDRLGVHRPACSTSPPPSCATSSSAACFAGGPGAPRGRRARQGLPQVVSLGALDMVNFGARDTVPPQFEERNLYVHNPSVTLMRTTPRGVRRARADHRGQARRARAGRWRCSCRSRAFRRSTSKAARSTTRPPTRRCSRRCARICSDNVELHELEHDINDPEFAQAMVDKLDRSTSRSAAR